MQKLILEISILQLTDIFSNIDAKQSFPIPVFPFFYWQWKNYKKK